MERIGTGKDDICKLVLPYFEVFSWLGREDDENQSQAGSEGYPAYVTEYIIHQSSIFTGNTLTVTIPH